MLLMEMYYNLFWHGFLISEAHPRKNPHLTWAGTMSRVISQRENGLLVNSCRSRRDEFGET
jgi:hypothetical protein